MLSFPAPRWQASLVPTTRSFANNTVAGRTASLILPRLYLSDCITASEEAILMRLGITHVVSVLERPPVLPTTPPLRTLHVPIADRSTEDILVYLPETTAFIKDALSENDSNKVLVHCVQGVSRSATVCAAYIVATTAMVPDEAIAFMQAKRGIVCPNLGFRRQLSAYAASLEPQRESQPKKSKRTSLGLGLGRGLGSGRERGLRLGLGLNMKVLKKLGIGGVQHGEKTKYVEEEDEEEDGK